MGKKSKGRKKSNPVERRKEARKAVKEKQIRKRGKNEREVGQSVGRDC